MDIRLDEGFLFGMGAFETIAVEKGKPILLEKHIERLEKVADFLQLGSCSAKGFSKEKVFSYLASQDYGSWCIENRLFSRKYVFSDAKEYIF